MLIFFVVLVSMNMLMIRTEDDIISIEINKTRNNETCNISKEVKLSQSHYTLKIKSDFFIYRMFLNKYDVDNPINTNNEAVQFSPPSNVSIVFQRSVGLNTNSEANTSIYFCSQIPRQEAPKFSQYWTFKFKLIKNYDPWVFKKPNASTIQIWTCNTSVEIDPLSVRRSFNPEIKNIDTGRQFPAEPNDNERLWLQIAIGIIVVLLIAQTSFIVYRKMISNKIKVKNNDKEIERNIANRAPLPLPPDEVIKNDPLPPVPVLHGAPYYHYAATLSMSIENDYECQPDSLRKESYTNQGLDTSEEEVTSPAAARRHLEGALVPKQPYGHKAVDKSDDEISNRILVAKQSLRNKPLPPSIEELRSPDFSRRHEGSLIPQQSYKNRVIDNPDEDDRSPGFGRRHEGPLIPKQSYFNKTDSDEETKTPGFARRQIEAKLGQLPPKGVVPSKSFKTSNPPPPIPQQSYRNHISDDSDEEIKTPGFPRKPIEANPIKLPPKGVAPSKSFKNSSPILPQQSYRNAAAEDSDEEFKTPRLARRQIEAKLSQLPPKGIFPSNSFKSPSPVITPKSHRNAESDDSDEESRTPGFARRQIEAKLGQLPPKGVAPSKSFKSPKPLPRLSPTPPSPLQQRAYHPAHIQDPPPVPPLHPKKPVPAFPTQEASRQQDLRRLSDDEWQYEKLQPSSKYLPQ